MICGEQQARLGQAVWLANPDANALHQDQPHELIMELGLRKGSAICRWAPFFARGCFALRLKPRLQKHEVGLRRLIP